MADANFSDFIAALNRHSQALEEFVKTAKAGGGSSAGSTGGSTGGGSTSSSEITKEQLTKRFGAYLQVADEGVRNKRIEDMGKLNKFFGVAKLSDGPKENWPKALQMLDQLEAGGNPFPQTQDASSLI